ncbi:hypothetical protein HFK18_12980|uniref:hypothetical protein n=1 Tax=Stenotrophomonas sp. SbOxS2 TaxID=2723885 RepID=UPI0015D3F300|nr:hypothetical protein [Stenotrophomonas sp. SbOxS2]NYT99395.1 hypothetical protein [Stenotrophomonas sp. SbOxS2]
MADLIDSLNLEVVKANGELISTRSLKRTLDFLQESIGVAVTSKAKPMPLAVLKTIRLIFLSDLNHSKNVLRLLAPPQSGRQASMEFSTVTTIPRDVDASELIQTLCESLAQEIDPRRISMLSRMLRRREKHSIAEELLLHMERTNDEVSQILHDAFGTDEALLTSAFRSLAAPLDQFRVQLIEGNTPPANEAMYSYLQTLPFRHFIQHYPKHLEATRVGGEIGVITEEAERFCQAAAHGAEHHHGPASRVFSVNSFQHLLLEHPEDICALVQKATGAPTTARQLQGHGDRVRSLLTSYAYRSFDCTDPDATVLSVYDVVAAFCSFRYQQERGEDYKPYWHGQTDQGKNPQRLFDKGLSDDQPYQHQGVMQIYLNRFYEYQTAFNGTTGSYRAWMNYQVAVLGAYQSVLDLKDITTITTGLNALNFYCVSLAKDLVIDHFRADH